MKKRGICFFPSSAPRLMIPDREQRFPLPFVLSIFVPVLSAVAISLGLAGSTFIAASSWKDVRKKP